jgi:hypothetical protein
MLPDSPKNLYPWNKPDSRAGIAVETFLALARDEIARQRVWPTNLPFTQAQGEIVLNWLAKRLDLTPHDRP